MAAVRKERHFAATDLGYLGSRLWQAHRCDGPHDLQVGTLLALRGQGQALDHFRILDQPSARRLAVRPYLSSCADNSRADIEITIERR
jgi:hypothetical protein